MGDPDPRVLYSHDVMVLCSKIQKRLNSQFNSFNLVFDWLKYFWTEKQGEIWEAKKKISLRVGFTLWYGYVNIFVHTIFRYLEHYVGWYSKNKTKSFSTRHWIKSRYQYYTRIGTYVKKTDNNLNPIKNLNWLQCSFTNNWKKNVIFFKSHWKLKNDLSIKV